MTKILLLLIALEIAGCAAMPEPACTTHRCDPSIDEQFKQNASWDSRTQDEYLAKPARH